MSHKSKGRDRNCFFFDINDKYILYDTIMGGKKNGPLEKSNVELEPFFISTVMAL